jgi:hypothetical protein
MSDIVAGKPRAIEKTRILLGEGVEEELFFGALLKHLGIPGVQVENYGGKSKLGDYLKALSLRTGFSQVQKVGITRDADEDPAGAAASVTKLIAEAGFPDGVTVTSMILPDNLSAGALENLFLRTISGKAIEACIEDYVTCAARALGRGHTTTANMAKARIHTWLAAQEEPDLRLGIAAQKGLVEFDSPAFESLKLFLKGLE